VPDVDWERSLGIWFPGRVGHKNVRSAWCRLGAFRNNMFVLEVDNAAGPRAQFLSYPMKDIHTIRVAGYHTCSAFKWKLNVVPVFHQSIQKAPTRAKRTSFSIFGAPFEKIHRNHYFILRLCFNLTISAQ